MGRLTKKQIAWWDAQPDAQTCSDCGKAGVKAYVQPQPEGGALCSDCISGRIYKARDARKAQLAACPRCEIPGCNRRGAFKSFGAILCAAHLKRANMEHQRKMSAIGGLALFLPVNYTRGDILSMAQGRPPVVGTSEHRETLGLTEHGG